MPIRTSREGNDRYAEIQLAMWFENVRNAEIQLSKDVLQEIQKLRNSGVSPENIVKSFMDKIDKGEGFEKHFLNDSAYELWKDMKAITQREVYKSMDDGDYYKWEYNPSAKHCEVCEELNGQIKTLEEWELEGLPGHRNEGCYANCCCDLVEVKGKEKKGSKEQVRSSKRDVDNYKKSNESSERNEDKSGTINSLPFDEKSIKLLKEEFKGTITFINLEILKKECGEELSKILNDYRNQVGEDTFKQLKGIVVEYKDTISYGEYKSKSKKIHINSKYYGVEINKDDAKDVQPFQDTMKEELWHSFYDKFNLVEDKDIRGFYLVNKGNIFKTFPILREYSGKATKQEEFIVRAFYKFEDGTLPTVTGQEWWNLVLSKFIKEKLESIKGKGK